MAKQKTGKLNSIEKAAIQTFFNEGKDVKEINELLNRSSKSSVVSNFVKKLSQPDETEIKLEEWKDVISQTVSDLVKSGITVENAQLLVKEGLKNIDLESEPSVNTLKSFAMANKQKMPLTQIKQWGRSSIVSGTEASSTSSDQTKGQRVYSRKEQGAVYVPNANKG